jgi:sugar lactone lactonase YvrE
MATLSSILGTGSFAPTSTALTAAATVDIDLTSDTFFTLTTDQNTTFTVSNVPAVSQFNLALTGFTVSSVVFDLASTVYDSKSLSILSNTTVAHSLNFKPDGTKMYVGETFVYQYTLSTPWDISTATYDSISLNLTAPYGDKGFRFHPDGTKMFTLGNAFTVCLWNLGTAWDISTAVFSVQGTNISAQGANPTSIRFKPDGTKMYRVGVSTDTVHQYSLSTAWDVTTISYDSVSKLVSAQDTIPTELDFSPDGTKMYIIGNTNNSIFQYTLSTAWDVSTATYDSASFNMSTAHGETSPYCMALKPDGTKMYAAGFTNDTVYQYTIGTITAATTTYPAGFKFPSGTTPAAPLDGDTDLLDFQSFDGGTTWYGKQLGSDYL